MAKFVDDDVEDSGLVEDSLTSEDLFDLFVKGEDLLETLDYFYQLCESLELNPQHYKTLYTSLKSHLTTWRCKNLWNKLDKKAKHIDYKNKPCAKLKILVIGAGPCGLRAAIEGALLGAQVVLVEKREGFSRNNVLHLWPFLIVDLKNLGAKTFFGKFCAGSLDHISIRKLQCILLKVCLLLGVQIYPQTAFEELIQPSEGRAWRAKTKPSTSFLDNYEFDSIIACDGKRNTLKGFKRKEFRGKLAIAVTCNFINRNTQAEARVEEISGVAFIFNQTFFRELKDKTGIDLENIVYYKDDTHYFVMTAKKKSLLEKGVIKKDYSDVVKLLARENVNHRALCNFATEAADFSTHYQLPHHEFAMNNYGKEDVAMFDFTSIFQAENSSRILERQGKRLMVNIAGDTLLEPFWPTGSGCARGFLGALDAAWMVRGHGLGKDPLDLLQERESIYTLLPQTTPDKLLKEHNNYSINPSTRYPNLNVKALKRHHVEHLYDSSTAPVNSTDQEFVTKTKLSDYVDAKDENVSPVDAKKLLRWCQDITSEYATIKIVDMSASWRNGLAFCAILHRFNPDLLNFWELDKNAAAKNCQLAFDLAEEHYGIPPKISGRDFAARSSPDRLVVISYLSLLYDVFKLQTPATLKSNKKEKLSSGKSPPSSPKKSPGSKLSIASRLSRRSRKKEQKTETRLQRKSRQDKENIIYEKTDGIMLKGYKPKSDDKLVLIYEEADDEISGGKKDLKQMEKPAANDVKFGIGERETMINGENGLSNGDARNVKPASDAPDLGDQTQAPNKVSHLAQILFGDTEVRPPKLGRKDDESEVCHFCKRHVYVMERMSAEGLFFHRRCFKCRACGCNLLLGNHAFFEDDDTPEKGGFYCKPHYDQILYCKQLPSGDEERGRSVHKSRRARTQVLDSEAVHEAFQEIAKRQELSPKSQEENNNDLNKKESRSPSDPSYTNLYRKFEAKPLVIKAPERVVVTKTVIPSGNLKHAVSTPSLQKLLREDDLFAEDRRRLSSISDNDPKRKLYPSNDLRNSIRYMLDETDNAQETEDEPISRSDDAKKKLSLSEGLRDVSPRRAQYPESVVFPDSFVIPGLKPVAVNIDLDDEDDLHQPEQANEDLNEKHPERANIEWARVEEKQGVTKEELNKPCEDDSQDQTNNPSSYARKPKKKKYVLRKVKSPKKMHQNVDSVDGIPGDSYGVKSSISTEDSPLLAENSSLSPEIPSVDLGVDSDTIATYDIVSEVAEQLKMNGDGLQLEDSLLGDTNEVSTEAKQKKKLYPTELDVTFPNDEKEIELNGNQKGHQHFLSPAQKHRKTLDILKGSPKQKKKLNSSDLKASSPKSKKKTLPTKEKGTKKKKEKESKKKKGKKGKGPNDKEDKEEDYVLVDHFDDRNRAYTDSLSSDDDTASSNIFRRAFGIREKKPKAQSVEDKEEVERRQKRKEMLKIEKEMKERKSKRLWQAQSIQRKMNEVDLKQFELDERALQVERSLRKDDLDAEEEGPLMMEWFRLVNEKNILLRFESELVIQANSVQLEDQQARLEQDIRNVLTTDHPAPGDQEKIDALTKELVDTVEQRNQLVEMLEDDRLREMEEDKQLNDVMVKKSQEFGMDRLI